MRLNYTHWITNSTKHISLSLNRKINTFNDAGIEKSCINSDHGAIYVKVRKTISKTKNQSYRNPTSRTQPKVNSINLRNPCTDNISNFNLLLCSSARKLSIFIQMRHISRQKHLYQLLTPQPTMVQLIPPSPLSRPETLLNGSVSRLPHLDPSSPSSTLETL